MKGGVEKSTEINNKITSGHGTRLASFIISVNYIVGVRILRKMIEETITSAEFHHASINLVSIFLFPLNSSEVLCKFCPSELTRLGLVNFCFVPNVNTLLARARSALYIPRCFKVYLFFSFLAYSG